VSDPRQTWLTPADLCARWQISSRTLHKYTVTFKLPWRWQSSRTRRIKESHVEAVEQRWTLLPPTSIRSST